MESNKYHLLDIEKRDGTDAGVKEKKCDGKNGDTSSTDFPGTMFSFSVAAIVVGLLFLLVFATHREAVPHATWNPFKRYHHGRVIYSSTESPDGFRSYRRETTTPCGYGYVLFNVSPAQDTPAKPFEYDITFEAYSFEVESGWWCFFYPSYKGRRTKHTGENPFQRYINSHRKFFPFADTYETNNPLWEPNDPTEIVVDPGHEEPTRISSRRFYFANQKPGGPRTGDYIIFAEGDFWTEEYWNQLKALIHSWKDDAVQPELDVE